MRRLRIPTLFLALWVISGAAVYWYQMWSWSPEQRASARPAFEAVLGSWVAFDVPLTGWSWSPSVAAVLTDPSGRTAWARRPAPRMAADLASLYPLPIGVVLGRIALIAACEAAVLQIVLVGLAGSMARSRPAGSPTPPPARWRP